MIRNHAQRQRERERRGWLSGCATLCPIHTRYSCWPIAAISAAGLLHKLDSNPLLNQARFRATGEKPTHRLPALVAVVERPIVHVHAHERVSLRAIKTARELHRVIESSRSMVQAVRNTVM